MRNILKINNITYKSDSKLTLDIKKYVRVIRNKQLKQTIKNGIVDTSANTLKWEQSVSFQFDDQQSLIFRFEIFDEHKFGFDQKQLLGVLHGQINFLISNINQNSTTYDVYNLKNQKVGSLSLEIDALILESQQSEASEEKQQNEQKYTVNVSSIITILNNFKKLIKDYKNVHCVASLHIGNKSIMTNNSKIFSEKMFWSQKLKNQLISQEIMQLRINYIDVDGSEKIICKGILDLSNLQKKNKLKSYRIQLIDNEQTQIGYCLVEIKCCLKSQNPQTTKTFEISRPKIIQTSVLFSNKNIIISKANRFSVSPRKDINDQVGYVDPLRNSLESKKRSISFKKSNQTKRYDSNPGVGRYKLPSIFDRYS